jgi:hypothetical protein
MHILFNARIDAFIPGNFVSWRIIKIPGEKTPAIEKDYDLTGIEVVTDALNLTVEDHGIAFMPEVHGYDRLKNAVFEIEKTARKTFRVVRYVGTLTIEYKVQPGASMAHPDAHYKPGAEPKTKKGSDTEKINIYIDPALKSEMLAEAQKSPEQREKERDEFLNTFLSKGISLMQSMKPNIPAKKTTAQSGEKPKTRPALRIEIDDLIG